MNLRLLVAFTVLGLSVAGAKSYDVNLPNAAKAGSMDLKAGKYSVVVDGSKVRFTDTAGKTTEAEATIQNSDKKFAVTQIDTVNANGQTAIREIDLGGSKTKLTFGTSSSGPAAQ